MLSALRIAAPRAAAAANARAGTTALAVARPMAARGFAAEALDKVIFTSVATNTGGGRAGAKVKSHGDHAFLPEFPVEKHPAHGGTGEVRLNGRASARTCVTRHVGSRRAGVCARETAVCAAVGATAIVNTAVITPPC